MNKIFLDAIIAGKREEVERQLDADPSLIHIRENELSPIMVAAYHGRPEIASFLADKTVALTIFEAAATGKINNIDHLEAKGRVEVFDWKNGKRTAEFPGDKHQGIVNRLAWAPDGSWLAAAGGAGEGFLIFLDGATKKPLHQQKMPMHVHDFAMTPDADRIVCVGHNRITVHTLG